MTVTEGVDVSICICTYKRSDDLNNLLLSLCDLSVGDLTLEIIIADNDPNGSATEVVTSRQKDGRFPITPLRVPVPNIALARNACVQAARGQWLAFIDDDETATPEWMTELVKVQKKYQADCVFGPVLPVLPESTPGWLIRGRYFDRRRYDTGTPIKANDARTGNALVSKKLLTGLPGPFDPAFGRSGGEDTVLFGFLMRANVKMVWCDEAIVYERVSSSRTSLSWLVRRSYRTGQSNTYANLYNAAPAAERNIKLRILVSSIYRIVTALPASLLLFPFSPHGSIRKMRQIARNVGRIAALLGHKYQEYGPGASE